MKTNTLTLHFYWLIGLIAMLCLPVHSAPLGTSFSYQGRLNVDGGAANGHYDFQFHLFSSETNATALAGPVSVLAVPVSNGVFQVTIDFGLGMFNGEERWLEIAVKNSLTDDLPQLLNPRQAITPAPYALHASNAGGLMSFANAPLDIKINGERVMRYEPAPFDGTANLIGGQNNQVEGRSEAAVIGGGRNNRINGYTLGAIIAGGSDNEVAFGSDFATISGGSGNLNAATNATIGGGAGNVINSNAVFSTIAGGMNNVIQRNIVGATISGGSYNVANGIWATVAGGSNNAAFGQYSVVSGGQGNRTQGSERATIAGGSANQIIGAFHGTISGGEGNEVGIYSSYGTVGGGYGNRVGGESTGGTIGGGAENFVVRSDQPTIGGGRGNEIQAFTEQATISGGEGNRIGLGCRGATIGGGSMNSVVGSTVEVNSSSTIGGGDNNQIEGGNAGSTIGGGRGNRIGFRSAYATVAGGESNLASAQFASVPGGSMNVAGGRYSLAAGRRALATNDGTFVWADSENADFGSTGTNQFLIRASGGVGINTDSPQFPLHVNGDAGKPGGGAWSVASDERLKKNIRPLEQALARLLQLHGVTYEYKDHKAIHELAGQQTGMIAQEVEKVFPDWVETTPDGMRRLSIRGFEALTVEALRELRIEKDEQIRARDERITAMEMRLAALEDALNAVQNSQDKAYICR